MTDSLTAFLDGLVEDLKHICIFSIESTRNSTGDDPEQQPDYVTSLLKQIGEVSCPGESTLCNGHGTCKEGRCVCDPGKLHVYYNVCIATHALNKCIGPGIEGLNRILAVTLHFPVITMDCSA